MKLTTEAPAEFTQRQADAARFVLDQDRGAFRLLAVAPPSDARLRQVRRSRKLAALSKRLITLAGETGRGAVIALPEWDWLAAAFLRELVQALQPTLQSALRSRHVTLSGAGLPIIALRSDGAFVRVDRAGQEDVLDPVQICRMYPELAGVLDTITAELVGVEQGVEIWGALALLRQCRFALEVSRPPQASVPTE